MNNVKSIKSAATTVESLEAIPEGEPWANAVNAAQQAIATARHEAAAELYPAAPMPIGADVTADLATYTEGYRLGAYGEFVAALHGDCLDTYPELSAALRGVVVRRRIGDDAATLAGQVQRPAAEVTAETIAAFELAVAGQLVGHGELDGPASVVVEANALAERVTVVVRRNEARAAAEAERVQAEQRAVDVALEQAADAEAQEVAGAVAESEREATRQRHRQHLLRSRTLADRLERSDKELRIGGERTSRGRGKAFSKSAVIRQLRSGDLSAEFMAQVAAALGVAA